MRGVARLQVICVNEQQVNSNSTFDLNSPDRVKQFTLTEPQKLRFPNLAAIGEDSLRVRVVMLQVSCENRM